MSQQVTHFRIQIQSLALNYYVYLNLSIFSLCALFLACVIQWTKYKAYEHSSSKIAALKKDLLAIVKLPLLVFQFDSSN